MAHHPRSGPQQQIAEPAHRRMTFGDQHAAIAARQRERVRHAPHRPRVVHQQRGADLHLVRQPCGSVGRVRVRGLETLHQSRVRDGGPKRRGQVNRAGRPAVAGGSAQGRRDGAGSGLCQSRRPEVHGELQPPALADERAARAAFVRVAARAPRRFALARNARRRHAPRHRSQRLGSGDGRLARERRQSIDQRAELKLAEEPDHFRPVVVGEAGRLQVERDRQIANDSTQLAAGEDLLARLHELVAELVGPDLVDAPVNAFERTELAHELRRRLLADARNPRDVVGRVALEGLVVDHLVRP